jgi:branched-chain amino acid transport system permease protein
MSVVQAIVDGILTAGLYALVAVGLSLILGILDSANFAHGQSLMVGAYAGYVCSANWHLPFVFSLLAAAAIAAVLGLVLEVVIFRRVADDHLLAMTASLGVILILQNVTEALFKSDPRSMKSPLGGAIHWGDITIGSQRMLVFVIAAVLMLAFYLYTEKSRGGLALRAVADSRDGAALMGVRITRTHIIVFVVGGALAGVAGALLASLFPITPQVGDTPLLKGFIVSIVGGLGSVPGTILAALSLGIVESLGARFVSASFTDGYGFIILVVVLLVRPNGIFGLARQERL